MDERAPLPLRVTRPTSGRVLLLAPHHDDDIIGAGGTCCLHAEAGDPVHVLVLYDGAKGDPEGRYDPVEYVALRKQEARRGGQHLELRDYEFWDYPEGHEPSDSDVIAAALRLTERVKELAPDVVYAPWIGEQHIDHHVLARVARLALWAAEFQGEAWGYEVWTPLIPTHIVDITHIWDRKAAAMREHATQMEYTDLIHKVLLTTAQRAIYLPKQALHGEALRPLGPPWKSDRALFEAAR